MVRLISRSPINRTDTLLKLVFHFDNVVPTIGYPDEYNTSNVAGTLAWVLRGWQDSDGVRFVYEYLFSNQELLGSGNLTDKEAGNLYGKSRRIYTLLGKDGGDLEYYYLQ